MNVKCAECFMLEICSQIKGEDPKKPCEKWIPWDIMKVIKK